MKLKEKIEMLLTQLRINRKKVEILNKSNDELQAENKELKNKLQDVNNDYNNDHKVHNEYEDGLLEEIKELKRDIKHKAIKINYE
mgnify:CR=1 FL=1